MNDWGDHNLPREPSPWDGVAPARRNRRWWYFLFLALFAAIAWPPLYVRIEPTIAGIPFVYWYAVGWIIAAVLTAVVYAKEKRRNPNGN